MKAKNIPLIEIVFSIMVILILAFMTYADAEEISDTENTTISIKHFGSTSSPPHGAIFVGDVPLLYFYERPKNISFRFTGGTIITITPEDIKSLTDAEFKNLSILISISPSIWSSHSDLFDVFLNRLMPQQFIDRAKKESGNGN